LTQIQSELSFLIAMTEALCPHGSQWPRSWICNVGILIVVKNVVVVKSKQEIMCAFLGGVLAASNQLYAVFAAAN
jgi:hypothetical protein